VSGTRWIAVMERLVGERPRKVIPGHGAVGDAGLLATVHSYLRELRDETWLRRDTNVTEETTIEEVRAVMAERHPDWAGMEWIANGVSCLCAEHEHERELETGTPSAT